uniref:Uncharacterized protein n=1 Tax=Rhizophora mucronata TaxID=61149 RepID=A0A2P2PJM2_RHIMU
MRSTTLKFLIKHCNQHANCSISGLIKVQELNYCGYVQGDSYKEHIAAIPLENARACPFTQL